MREAGPVRARASMQTFFSRSELRSGMGGLSQWLGFCPEWGQGKKLEAVPAPNE